MTVTLCSPVRLLHTRFLTSRISVLACTLAAIVVIFTIASIAMGQSNPSSRKASPGTATGTKRTAALAGRVVDESGQPIEHATVMIAPTGKVDASDRGIAEMARFRRAVADERGHFSLEDLDAGIYYLTPAVPGYVQVNDDSQSRQVGYRPGDSVTLRMAKGGVITGRVTGPNGEPVVRIIVGAIRINKNGEAAPGAGFAEGMRRSPFEQQLLGQFSTDDRGIYRIYGLKQGTYLVSAGIGTAFFPAFDPFSGSAPTYYPSSARGSATPVEVRLSEETGGIDIRYRDQAGYSISGTVTGKTSSTVGLSVNIVALADAQTNAPVGTSISMPIPDQGGPAFTFSGIPDGDYRIQAIGGDGSAASNTREISIKGADVSGIELVLTPFSSIYGHLDIDKPLQQPAACKTPDPLRAEEIMVYARVDSKKRATPQRNLIFPAGSETAPDRRGEFNIQHLREGLHRVEAQPVGEDYYVRSVTLPASGPSGRRDASRTGIAIKPGENVNGVLINISPGAAGIAGIVVAGSGPTAERLLDPLRIHLVPAEEEAREDVLRFAESGLSSGDTFKFSNIAPGRYWIIALKSSDDHESDAEPRPVAWDAEGRVRLRKLGAETKVEIDLKPCQREKDYVLRYLPSAGAAQKGR